MKHTGLGIHIALSKYPLGHEKEYIKNLQTLYELYSININKYLELNQNPKNDSGIDISDLYKPAIYHIYSHFDVAFVSIIDNFKFPQRVFEAWGNEVDSIKSVSYQILSGSILETEKSPNPKDVLNADSEFLKIIQLKLNNGLLIGNGAVLFENCIKLIEEALLNAEITKYIFINSFNWGEITVLCSNKDPNILAKALMRIRLFTVEYIKDPIIAEEIRLNSLCSLWKVENVNQSHLFSETSSYLGVDFFNYTKIDKNTPFITNIEWQIKPGHLPYFAEEMKASPLDFDIDYSKVYFKNGKTDYVIIEKEPDILGSNIGLFELLRQNTSINSHVRKIKTKPLFRIDCELAKELNTRAYYSPIQNSFSSENFLSKYKITNSGEVTKYLRKLNVSRNIRKKVNKIIYNYNLGIQDPILFIYFIDLHNLLLQFIDKLRHLSTEIEGAIVTGKLSNEFSVSNFMSLKTTYIQDELINVYIDVFQKALNDRILNNYNYEDINEFSLDINSPLTSIVSSLDSIVKFYGSCFRDSEGNSIITTINDNETISNKISVNYNIEHITNVPLIFSTLIKEILNIEQTTNEIENSKHFEYLSKEFNENTQHWNKLDKDFLKALNFAYFEIDFKKYYLTFFRDSDLYIFWHWTYALQCTHLYSSIGYFDEINFSRELFRLILLLKATDPNKIEELQCPNPELRTYWDKYFNRIRDLVDIIGNANSFKLMSKSLMNQVHTSINNIDAQSNGGLTVVKSNNDVNEFLNKLGGYCITIADKNVEDFIKFIHEQIAIQNSQIIPPSKSAFYRILSYISFYNLTLIKTKFKGNNNLLRRSYQTGVPIDHFLQNKTNWFIDPFGGFFINNLAERKENMSTNNQMLYLIWHLGVILKKLSFENKIT